MPKLLMQKDSAIGLVTHQCFSFHFTSTSPYHCQACWFSLSFDSWIRSFSFIQWRSMISKILYKIDWQVEARYQASWPSHLHHTWTAPSSSNLHEVHAADQGPCIPRLRAPSSWFTLTRSSKSGSVHCLRRTVACLNGASIGPSRNKAGF